MTLCTLRVLLEQSFVLFFSGFGTTAANVRTPDATVTVPAHVTRNTISSIPTRDDPYRGTKRNTKKIPTMGSGKVTLDNSLVTFLANTYIPGLISLLYFGDFVTFFSPKAVWYQRRSSDWSECLALCID